VVSPSRNFLYWDILAVAWGDMKREEGSGVWRIVY